MKLQGCSCAGLDEEAARLEAEGGASFFVVPVQHNGQVRNSTLTDLPVARLRACKRTAWLSAQIEL